MHILSLKVFKEFKYILVRLWNDEMCSISQGFVCKKPREGTWTTQPSTPFPQGNADIIAITKLIKIPCHDESFIETPRALPCGLDGIRGTLL